MCLGASHVAQLVKNPPAMRDTWVRSLGWEDPWRRERLPTPVFWPGEFHRLYSPWGCQKKKKMCLETKKMITVGPEDEAHCSLWP